MGLEEEAAAFGTGPYLRGGPSSFTRGGEGSLLYFWEDPDDQHVYVVQTQAPYIIRRIQRAFGSPVDGRYGSVTANAIVRAMRESGDPSAANASAATEASPGVMAYALLRAMHGGRGRIAFPTPTQFPDVDVASLAPGSSTAIRVIDASTGRDVPIRAVSATEWEPVRPGATPAPQPEPPPVNPAPAPAPAPGTTIRTGILPGPDGTFAQLSPCGEVACPPVRWEDPLTYPKTIPGSFFEYIIKGSVPVIAVGVGALAAASE